jgi:hypothetical protein
MTYWVSSLLNQQRRLGPMLMVLLFFLSILTLALTYVAGWTFASAHFLPLVFLPVAILLIEYWIASPKWHVGRKLFAAVLAGAGFAWWRWDWIVANVSWVRALVAGWDAFRQVLSKS